VFAEAGCSLSSLVKWCAVRQLSGLEFAAGIPGSVGGAVMMNAGAWGGEIGDYLKELKMVDRQGKIYNLAPRGEHFSYRCWQGAAGHVVAGASFRLQKGSRAEIEEKIVNLGKLRKKRQPMKPSAGSFFKNPLADSAGRLIEKAGLKGHKVGGAQISERHANFIVNYHDGLASDIFKLMKMAQREVFERFGVMLEPEVELIGDFR